MINNSIIIISAILLIYISENNLAPPTSDQEGLELYYAIRALVSWFLHINKIQQINLY